MFDFKKPLAAAAAATLFVTSAFAQATDDELTALLAAWVGGEGGYDEGIFRDYGIACLLPGVLAMPDAAKATLVEAGGMEAGLTQIETADPETLNIFLPLVQECVETLIIGEQIQAWATIELPDEVETVTVCMMDAIRPLDTDAKQIIVLGEDFEDGIEALLEERTDLADLENQIEACD